MSEQLSLVQRDELSHAFPKKASLPENAAAPAQEHLKPSL